MNFNDRCCVVGLVDGRLFGAIRQRRLFDSVQFIACLFACRLSSETTSFETFANTKYVTLIPGVLISP